MSVETIVKGLLTLQKEWCLFNGIASDEMNTQFLEKVLKSSILTRKTCCHNAYVHNGSKISILEIKVFLICYDSVMKLSRDVTEF